MLRSVTVLIDKNEAQEGHLPLPFPDNLLWYPHRSHDPHLLKVKTKVIQLDAGDYALDGFTEVSLVETKRSMRELQNNLLTKDFRRSTRAFERLASACTYPYLLLEMLPSAFSRPSRHVPEPDRVFDALCWEAQRYGLRLWFGGAGRAQNTRRLLGAQVIRVLLAHAMYDDEGEDQESIMQTIRKIREE